MAFEDIQLHIHRLVTWTVFNGGFVHPDVEFAFHPVAGTFLRVKSGGAVKNSTLPKGTRVISCPHSLTLSALDAWKTSSFVSQSSPRFDINLPHDLLGAARPQCIAALWLCVQKHLGSDSFWHEYIACLPGSPSQLSDSHDQHENGLHNTEVNTPIWWSDHERTFLSGTHVDKGTNDIETLWAREWNQWSRLLESWAIERNIQLSW